MNLPDLKELSKLIKRCRALGVEQIEVTDDGIKLTLSPQEAPGPSAYRKKIKGKATGEVHNGGEHATMPETLSEEDLLFFSATPGLPFHVQDAPPKPATE